MYSWAFGLSIESDARIPGLIPTHAPTSTGGGVLRVYFDANPPGLDGARDEGIPWPAGQTTNATARTTRALAGGRWIAIDFPDGVRFIVRRDGHEIWFRRPAAFSMEYVAIYLLGPVIGLALRLRSMLCLHASAISIAGHAITLVGAAQSGKSTTAAALSRRGLPVLADDIAVIDIEPDGPRVRPSYPRLRLWPDSSTMVFGPAVELERLTADWDKRFLDLSWNTSVFAAGAGLLSAIYVLADRAAVKAPAIEKLSSKKGLLALIANSYGNLFLDEAMRRHEFAALARLAHEVPIFLATPSADPAQLDKLCDLLIVHATTMSPGAAAISSLANR